MAKNKKMLPNQRYGLLLGAAIICMGAICKTPQRDQAMLKIVSQKNDAQLQVHGNAESVIIDIFSESGIGQAEFELLSPVMPKQLVMQFHLRGLEELRFGYGKTVITASLASTGEHGIRQRLSRIGEEPVQVLTSNSPFWMKIRMAPHNPISVSKGYIAVEAPADFFVSGARQAAIHWTDFYR